VDASLYIHIPFCSPGKCDYCDFFSIIPAPHENTLFDSFIDAVLCDIQEQLAFFTIEYVPTVYIGGGTPSVLGAARMERLLNGLHRLLEPMKKSIVECTVEANPESVDTDFLRICAKGGVTRISLGVQTFHEPSRRAIHRAGHLAGGSTLFDERLALAAQYFPGAFSVDLIAGLPFQTNALLLQDIHRVLAFEPAHVSLYSLILEPETPLGKQVSQLGHAAGLSLPNDDDADKLWISGRNRLEAAGLTQYEVSNFALPGKTCAHNIRYWRMENWIGAGPAASGTIIDDAAGTGRRFTYPADIKTYLAASDTARIHSACIEELDQLDLMQESLLMGFRYRGGPDQILFKQRFGRTITDCIPQTINRWRNRNFFETENSLAPSPEGLLFVNAFLRDAFGELQKE